MAFLQMLTARKPKLSYWPMASNWITQSSLTKAHVLQMFHLMPMVLPPTSLPLTEQRPLISHTIGPGATILHEWASKVADVAPIVFDPNVRSSVVGDRDLYQAAVAKWAAISSVIKVSDDDLAWLYPDRNELDIAKEWVADGCALVVITKGADGLVGVTADGVVSVPGVKITVADTVGAGDTVGAIVVEAIIERGLASLTGDVLVEVLARAAKAAAITCSRAGANPPTKAELEA